MTPRARSPGVSEDSLLTAPRSLKELVTWRFSYLTKTSAPVSADSFGAGSMGVRSTWPAMARRAFSISANVTGTAVASHSVDGPLIAGSSLRPRRRPLATCVQARLPSFFRRILRIKPHDRTAAHRLFDRGEAPRL